jgi:hypothetical protein
MKRVKAKIERLDVFSDLPNIEDQLTSMLSEELAKSIDREILKSLGLEPDKWKRRMNKINKIYKI